MRAQLPEAKLHKASDDKISSKQQVVQERIERIKPWRFQPGRSGNPGGRPRRDVASEISRAIFESNPEAVYEAQSKRILKGDPYAFKEHAERAYGKLTEKHEISGSAELLDRLLAGRKKVQGRGASK